MLLYAIVNGGLYTSLEFLYHDSKLLIVFIIFFSLIIRPQCSWLIYFVIQKLEQGKF